MMQAEKRLTGIPGNPVVARNDRMLCVFLLAACLAYDCYTGIAYLTSLSHGIFDFAWRPLGRDFVNYWTAGVAVFEGMIPEIFDTDIFHPYQERLLGHPFAVHAWSYPPHMLLVVAPLGLMPYLWALALWSFATLGAYLWAATAGRQDHRLLLLALLLAPATFANFFGGQNGFLTGALLIGGLRLLGSRPVLAGILFGILTVKPQLGLLLPFALLAARQWTAIAAATATTLLLVGASILLFGWESWRSYFDLAIPHQAVVMNERNGVFLFMTPSVYMGLRLLEVEPLLRNGIQAAFLIIALAGVIWTFARSKDDVLKFGVLAVGTFLASPYGFNYDMTTVSLAVVLIAVRALREGFQPGERLALAATWLLPTAIALFNAARVPIGSLILLLCFACLLIRVRHELKGAGLCGFPRAEPPEAASS